MILTITGNQLIHMYTFVVTNMDSAPEELIRFYCKRGSMENFIKESKNGFDFTAVSSSSKIVNANRLQIHALAYNIFNLFKCLVLPEKMRKQQIDTIRLKLLKIAVRLMWITEKCFGICWITIVNWSRRRCMMNEAEGMNSDGTD